MKSELLPPTIGNNNAVLEHFIRSVTKMEFLQSLIANFSTGGIWMWVILAFSIAAIAICVERYILLYKQRQLGELEYSKEYETMIRAGKIDDAINKSREDKEAHPICGAIEAGLMAAKDFGGRDEIQGKMDEVLLAENNRLEQRTGYLAMLANVGTLTGLLGTIAGMIKAFSAVTNANPAEKATLLAGGISEAMNTTAFGLIMAIPTLVVFAIYTSRTNNLVEDLNQGALKIYNWISYAYEPVPVQNMRKTASNGTQSARA